MANTADSNSNTKKGPTLHDFIKTALVDISKSVITSQSELIGTGAKVNPELERDNVDSEFQSKHPPKGVLAYRDTGNPVLLVDFDVAVTASDTAKGKIGAGIRVMSVVIGGDKTNQQGTESVSRISFQLPIELPPMK